MNNETLETTLNDNNIIETELSDSKVLETEIIGIQKSMETDHSKLDNLDFEHSGHTGFQPAGDYVEDSNYTHTDNNYTTEEKTKLFNLENYDDTEVKADISALEDIEETQNQEIVNIKANKADKSEIPDVSDFITNSVNDLINYYLKSETYTKTEVNNLIGAINQFHYEIVQALPITGENNILYLVPKSTSETENIYDEYVYASGWEKIGDTQIDLSDYVTTTQLNTALADYTTTANLTTLLAGKQDALVSGTNIKTINNQSILGANMPFNDIDYFLTISSFPKYLGSNDSMFNGIGSASSNIMQQAANPYKLHIHIIKI